MSFADKELLQVRQYVFFVFLPSFLKNFLEWSKAITHSYCCLSSCFAEVNIIEPFRAVCSPPAAAPGYENLCGRRLRHSAGSPAPQGHHSAGETSKESSSSTTSLWSRPSSSTSSRPWGWLILLCREVKQSDFLTTLLTYCLTCRPTTSPNALISSALLSLVGGGNMVAIDLIVQHVHSQLEEVSGHSTDGI